ncbi:hypothetical protein B0H14DRAFT_3585396 [Mycena olivaceomarginata]|nr:hypothetical protein B0H14DRAFT_3585396 [Mycena olivaceomarginata]
MAARETKSCSAEDPTLTLNPKTLLLMEKSLGSPSPPPESHTPLSSMPVWLSGPLQSPRAWKVLLRCWVATLAFFIILLPNASLRTIGPFAAPVFVGLSSWIEFQLRSRERLFKLLSTLVAGLLSEWGIGIGAMRAADAVRNQALAHSSGRAADTGQANPVFQANPALAQTTAVFSGWFLDARDTWTVDIFCMRLPFIPSIYIFPLKIACPWAVGPLFPSQRYTLLNYMAISMGCYMAIVIVTTLFIFPETTSHAALDTDIVLGARPEELTSDGTFIRKFKTLLAKVIGTQQQLVFSRCDLGTPLAGVFHP